MAADAPGQLALALRPLDASDLDRVLAIEREAFSSPWRREHFLHELTENRWAENHAVECDHRLAGYACVWHLFEELRINNLAVAAELRGRGIGAWLLHRVVHAARRAGCTLARLEVRPSNSAAVRLYEQHGFIRIGTRKGFYQADGEDAWVMEAALADDRV